MRSTGMTRLHLLSSAGTFTRNSVAFPSDEPLGRHGRRMLSKVGRLPPTEVVLCSPTCCAAQTAEGLGLTPTTSPQLRDCDFGSWAGLSLEEVQSRSPEKLAEWLRNSHAAPHGGESFADVTRRVAEWMSGLLAQHTSILAITHPAVIRAAVTHVLAAAPEAFRHIDIGPLTRVIFSRVSTRWVLAAILPLRDVR